MFSYDLNQPKENCYRHEIDLTRNIPFSRILSKWCWCSLSDYQTDRFYSWKMISNKKKHSFGGCFSSNWSKIKNKSKKSISRDNHILRNWFGKNCWRKKNSKHGGRIISFRIWWFRFWTLKRKSKMIFFDEIGANTIDFRH